MKTGTSLGETIETTTRIEKILMEHEMFGLDRFLLQPDIGGLPHDRVMRAIELFGTEVAPAVRSALAEAPTG